MNILFLVIIPIATILISIVLQKILKKPVLVAILAFAIFLILAYTVFTTEFLLNAIVYTILAFLTAIITCLIHYLTRDIDCNICSREEDSLEGSIEKLERSIDSLEGNIAELTKLLSMVMNNNCGCNRRLR